MRLGFFLSRLMQSVPSSPSFSVDRCLGRGEGTNFDTDELRQATESSLPQALRSRDVEPIADSDREPLRESYARPPTRGFSERKARIG